MAIHTENNECCQKYTTNYGCYLADNLVLNKLKKHIGSHPYIHYIGKIIWAEIVENPGKLI